MKQITKNNYDKILYCPICGSTNVTIELWWEQETEDLENPLEKAWNSEGVCLECGDNTFLLTLPELWDKWKNFEQLNTRYNGTRVELADTFLGFEEGTPVSDIMNWFDARCPNSIDEDLVHKE